MNYLKKISISFLFIVSLIFLFPQQTKAQYTDILNSPKEYGLDAIAWEFANTAVRRITTQTVNWINSGFQGSPAYIQNPKQFFLNVADNQASRFLSGTSLNQLCSPFRAQVRLALVRNYLQEDVSNYSCSLSILRNNYDQFMNDFSQGGWDGWFELTQNDTNNPYGAYLAAQDQLSINVGTEQKKYQEQLQWGKGFLSFEVCPEGQELDPSLGTGDCMVEKVVATPGSVIVDQLNLNLNTGLKKLEAADELSEILSALISQLTLRVVGGIGNGLFGTSNPPSGQTSYTGDLGSEASPPDPTVPPLEPNIPPCPSDLGYSCAPPPDTNSCVQPPTDSQRLLAEQVTAELTAVLNAGTSGPVPFCEMERTPSQDCQDFVNSVVDEYNERVFQSTGIRNYASYYPMDNTVRLPFTYIIGPNTQRVSDTIGPGSTWRSGTHTTCAPGTGGGGTGGGGTGGGGTGTASGAWNIVGTLDIGSVNIVGPAPDVRGWAETTQITNGSWDGAWNVDFTQENSWGTCETPGVFGPVSYTIWAFVQVSGQWYGSAFERNYPGDSNSGGPGNPRFQLPQNWWYDTRWPNMYGHYPATGEQVGFMVTNGNHRLTDSPCTATQSRSNIVLVTMP